MTENKEAVSMWFNVLLGGQCVGPKRSIIPRATFISEVAESKKGYKMKNLIRTQGNLSTIIGEIFWGLFNKIKI